MEETPTPAAAPAETEAPSINSNQAAEQIQVPTEAPKTPDLHGFTEEQLADMAKFYAANGGFDAVKSKISNPQQAQPVQKQEPQAQQQDPQMQQPVAQPPKGYASLQELSVERYFKDLAADPKYENIADQISSGNVLKEMAAMGMNPIDNNYNINVDQLNQFLALKAASVPAKQTSVEPTNTPTVEYVPMDGDNITSMEQAINIARQSTQLRSQGMQPHPAEAKALEYMKNNGFAQ